MSTLLIDIGNSRIKWVVTTAALEAPLPPAQAVIHHGDVAAAVQQITSALQGQQQVFIAHVTGAAHEAAIVRAVQAALGLAPVFARSSAACLGLRSAYAESSKLGVDRWLSMLALWSRTQQAFCVASAGTALTFDAVDASGQHQGGVIAPGVAALIETTLGHTRFAVGEMKAAFVKGLGQDTEACVRQGALHAAAGLLDRLQARYPGVCVLSGGDAQTLIPHLAAPWQQAPDLVLQGLALWAQSAAQG